MKKQILIADDDEVFVDDIKLLLTDDFDVSHCRFGEESLEILKNQSPDVLLLDIDFGPKRMDGIQVLKEIIKLKVDVPVIMISKMKDVSTVVKAMKLGAYDYIGKSPNLEELNTIITRALDNRTKNREIIYLRESLSRNKGKLIGSSSKMMSLRRTIDQVAKTPTTVLITGETGTGKELVAREIHNRSDRSSKSFIAVSLTDVPKELFESELFGHEKGAFTGAITMKPGCFEIAQEGTIFLDEIGDMPLEAQSKLLRVLEEKMVRHIGSTRSIPVDVRVIAATNQNLEDLVEKNLFRKDLYYRIHIFPVHIPPLRDRMEDVPALTDHFLKLSTQKIKKPISGISNDALDALKSLYWPGNIRELSAVIESAVIRCTGDKIEIFDLRFPLNNTQDQNTRFANYNHDEAHDLFRKEYFLQLLTEEKGNVSSVAERSGIQRPSLYKIFDKLKLNPEEFRQ